MPRKVEPPENLQYIFSEELARLWKIESAAKAFGVAWHHTLVPIPPGTVLAMAARRLVELVSPSPRIEPRAGMRIKWSEEGEDQSGTIAGQMSGTAKSQCAFADKWMVRIDGASGNFRELPEDWSEE